MKIYNLRRLKIKRDTELDGAARLRLTFACDRSKVHGVLRDITPDSKVPQNAIVSSVK